MGILHHLPHKADKAVGLSVKCPKCLAPIVCTGLRGDAPIRCGKCSYPLICRSDLTLLISACKKVSTAQQASCAVGILRHLSEFMPEAATALGMLPTQLQFALPLSEAERWTLLSNAYAAGDDDAQAGLKLMRQSSPSLYGQSLCKKCGAPKYFEKHNAGKTVCPYCQTVG